MFFRQRLEFNRLISKVPSVRAVAVTGLSGDFGTTDFQVIIRDSRGNYWFFNADMNSKWQYQVYNKSSAHVKQHCH